MCSMARYNSLQVALEVCSDNKCSLYRENLGHKPGVDIQSYELFQQTILQGISGQQETGQLHVPIFLEILKRKLKVKF